MDETPLLKLPYILAAQSQKHVTHNEALRALDAVVQLAVEDKDLSTPPGSPAEGARYIVSASPTGAWAGHATHVAAWQDGAWAFYVPVAGWLAWVHDESQSYLFSGGGWIPAPGGGGGSGLVPKGAWSSAATYVTGDLVEHEGHAFLSNIDDNLDNEPDADTPGSTDEWTYFAIVTGGGGGGEGGGDVNPVPLVGVNATADTTNRLSVASPASLFNHEGAGHQLKINKAAAGDTASVLFQADFTGHAEFGLAGDNDWHVKVSPDGSAWHEAIVVDRSTGAVSFPNTSGAGGGREMLAANRTYYVRTDGSDSNTGLANTSGGAFLTIQKAVDTVAGLDLGIYDATIKVAAGTYTAATELKSLIGAGRCIIEGDTTTPSNIVVNTTGVMNFYSVEGTTGRYLIQGFQLQTTTSGTCINLEGAGMAVEVAAVIFGAASGIHIAADKLATVRLRSNYTIAGGAQAHVWANRGGVIHYSNSPTITVSGTPAFSVAFARAENNGVLHRASGTFSGDATGTRYAAALGGVINVNGGGGSVFPGNAGGSTATGGQYA